ncbi:tail assembly chaperone [Peribacillus simplex]|uniref:Tail assembly chaperone n=2 Tax=Peribacillus TaxID=2675229 RepID=A0AA90PEX7_9BACI|nr:MULTISPECIES: tail assembly chaperone [Peribacillus]MDP1419230.1 tail assembly chaperone [Peribacillus simplex]MDP1452132.1 tail assembly chaperone [Peribacillus frigoritolerans]
MTQATFSKIKINGEEYILKFTFNAISDLEEHYQKGIFSVVQGATIGFNTVRNFYWAGMLWKNPNLQPHHVGAMLEQEMEENEDFDIQEHMEEAVKALTNSKAFKLMMKRAEAKQAREDSKN